MKIKMEAYSIGMVDDLELMGWITYGCMYPFKRKRHGIGLQLQDNNEVGLVSRQLLVYIDSGVAKTC
jgi:hypothetical protein